jgi:hypothetical protein
VSHNVRELRGRPEVLNFGLLECAATWFGRWVPMFRRNLLPPSSEQFHFGTHQLNYKASIFQKDMYSLVYAFLELDKIQGISNKLKLAIY